MDRILNNYGGYNKSVKPVPPYGPHEKGGGQGLGHKWRREKPGTIGVVFSRTGDTNRVGSERLISPILRKRN